MLLAKRDTEEKREDPSIVLIESLQHLVKQLVREPVNQLWSSS